MVGVQNFKFSGYMTVSGLCMHDFGNFWKILENFLLFTEIPTEKMRIRKHTVPNHIWCHIHAKFRGLKSHLITSESHPRVTSGQNSEATRYLLFRSDFDVPGFFLHACARTDHSVSEIIRFKSAAGSISFRSTVSQSCSIHACVG